MGAGSRDRIQICGKKWEVVVLNKNPHFLFFYKGTVAEIIFWLIQVLVSCMDRKFAEIDSS